MESNLILEYAFAALTILIAEQHRFPISQHSPESQKLSAYELSTLQTCRVYVIEDGHPKDLG